MAESLVKLQSAMSANLVGDFLTRVITSSLVFRFHLFKAGYLLVILSSI